MAVVAHLLTAACAFAAGLVTGVVLSRRPHGKGRSLEYRASVQAAAAAAGDADFLAREVERNQLSEADLARLRQCRTPIERWPEPAEGLMDPSDVIGGGDGDESDESQPPRSTPAP